LGFVPTAKSEGAKIPIRLKAAGWAKAPSSKGEGTPQLEAAQLRMMGADSDERLRVLRA